MLLFLKQSESQVQCLNNVPIIASEDLHGRTRGEAAKETVFW